MRPLGRAAATALGTVAFLLFIADVRATGLWRLDFRIDEAFKISETPFLGLWMKGDVHNDAWFDNIIDRIDPPVGKYAFGAAILLSGQTLPPFPTLAVQDPSVPAFHSEKLAAPYRPYLRAVRWVSILASALTAALLATILARYHGWISAAAAVAFFALSFITQTHAPHATFDALLTLFFMASVALMTILADRPSTRRVAVAAVAIGIVTALAFQTRLNGLYAFAVAIPFLWITLHRTVRKAILATALAGGAFVATTLALNPYYWSTPTTRIEPFSSHHGLLRPVQRLVQQQSDIMLCASSVRAARKEARTLPEKAQFLSTRIMGGDLPGWLMMLSAMAGIVLLAVRWRSLAPPVRTALLMSIAVVATMIATLPMPWVRYLLVVIPPLALVAGFATAEGVSTVVRRTRRA